VLSFPKSHHSHLKFEPEVLYARVCEGGSSRPCARGVQAPLFAVLARERARLSRAKNDATAGLLRNADFLRFFGAELAAARRALAWAPRSDSRHLPSPAPPPAPSSPSPLPAMDATAPGFISPVRDASSSAGVRGEFLCRERSTRTLAAVPPPPPRGLVAHSLTVGWRTSRASYPRRP
jgi:hypothetical protein